MQSTDPAHRNHLSLHHVVSPAQIMARHPWDDMCCAPARHPCVIEDVGGGGVAWDGGLGTYCYEYIFAPGTGEVGEWKGGWGGQIDKVLYSTVVVAGGDGCICGYSSSSACGLPTSRRWFWRRRAWDASRGSLGQAQHSISLPPSPPHPSIHLLPPCPPRLLGGETSRSGWMDGWGVCRVNDCDIAIHTPAEVVACGKLGTVQYLQCLVR